MANNGKNKKYLKRIKKFYIYITFAGILVIDKSYINYVYNFPRTGAKEGFQKETVQHKNCPFSRFELNFDMLSSSIRLQIR